MIKSNNGDLIIGGTLLDVTINYMQITDELLRVTPEIVVAAFDARSDIIEKKLPNIDPEHLAAARDVTKRIRFKE